MARLAALIDSLRNLLKDLPPLIVVIGTCTSACCRRRNVEEEAENRVRFQRRSHGRPDDVSHDGPRPEFSSSTATSESEVEVKLCEESSVLGEKSLSL